MRAVVAGLLLAAGLLSASASAARHALAHEEPAAQGTAAADLASGAGTRVSGGPAVIAALRANGARVLALGERGGLDGHLVELADGDAYGLYLTADGHALAGLLYGPDGALLTASQIAAAGGSRGRNEVVPTDDARLLAHGYDERAAIDGVDALFERSGSAFGFTLGRTGPRIVVFADPACRWSRSAVARLGGPALDGRLRLRLRVVPVGVLGAASAREAASIASAPDPALAWFEGTNVPGSPAGAQRIARNNALFEVWGARTVPLIAWRARDGRILHRLGDLDDVEAWLEALPHE